jgi:hypothetical protein
MPSGAWSSDAAAGSQRGRGSAAQGSRQLTIIATLDPAAHQIVLAC